MPKRTMQGTVVSDKADKTVTVSVERTLCIRCIKRLSPSPKSLQHMMLKTV